MVGSVQAYKYGWRVRIKVKGTDDYGPQKVSGRSLWPSLQAKHAKLRELQDSARMLHGHLRLFRPAHAHPPLFPARP